MSNRSLKERLGGVSDASLDAFLSMLVHRHEPSAAVFSTMLAEGASAQAIQRMILERRKHVLVEKLGSGSEKSHEAADYFDHLSLMLIDMLEGQWRSRVSELESRLSVAGTELQMASARSRWSKEGEVTLYNYFREVPIMARVAIHDMREGGLAVAYSTDLVHVVAAGQYGKFAHIRLADLHSCLRLEVEGVLGGRVQFRFAGIFQTARERRRHIRVLCEDHLRLSLIDTDGQSVQASVNDICQAGLGLDMQMPLAAVVGDAFDFKLSLRSGEVQGIGILRWLNTAGARTQFGLDLDLTPALLRKLQLEVSQRQKRILSGLRMLGVPDSLI
ncbi:MAG: hypothetical protein Q9M30_08080 [Mariprofundaceae bacterium]|nr:hypothetical protein [Mariprofundaceae bacterium]